jgi:hypothetical protein
MRFTQSPTGVEAIPPASPKGRGRFDPVDSARSAGEVDTIVRYIYLKICFTTYLEMTCIIVFIFSLGDITGVAGLATLAGDSWATWAAEASAWAENWLRSICSS